MGTELNGKRVAFLATDGVEQVELTEPWEAVEKAGGEPELVSLQTGKIQGFSHHDKGDTFPVDKAVKDANASDYDGLVLPGGVVNPDSLRMDAKAMAFVQAFFEQGKPVGAICHGPWSLVETGVVKGGRSRPGRAEDGHPKRRRHVGRRGARHRPRPLHEPQAGRPTGLLREAGRGVRRGQARRAA